MTASTEKAPAKVIEEQVIRTQVVVQESTSSEGVSAISPPERRRSGPNTVEGKAAVAGNAIDHGIFAKAHVLPGVERAEDWETHLAGMRESLAPADYLETVLVDRAAQLSWRFLRLARYEAAALYLNQPKQTQEITRLLPERAKQQSLTGWSELDELDEAIGRAQLRQVPLDTLATHSDPTLPREAAHELVNALIDGEGLGPREIPRLVRKLLESTRDALPAADVRKAVKALASAVGKSRAAMLQQAVEEGKKREAIFQTLKAWATAERQLLEGLQLLPDPDHLQRVMRYEATLSRQFHQTLHELEARQARRRGEATPLLRVDHHGLPEGAEGSPVDRAPGETHKKPLARMPPDSPEGSAEGHPA